VSLGRRISIVRAAVGSMNSRIVLLTLISTFLLFALVVAASAQTRTVGVSVGNKFRYSFIISWSSNDPSATPPSSLVENNNTEWMEISVIGISGTNVTGQTIQHYKNGTETTMDVWIDLNTGPSGNTLPYFISANLAAGDSAYTSFPFNNTWIINETVSRTYLNGARDTNHINATASSETQSFPTNMYWDKSTGVFVELMQEATNKTDAYTATSLFDIQIISPDLGTIPEFPAWISVLLILIALTSAKTVIARQRHPTKTLR
jgi:hypothetical protein